MNFMCEDPIYKYIDHVGAYVNLHNHHLQVRLTAILLEQYTDIAEVRVRVSCMLERFRPYPLLPIARIIQ